MANFGPVTLAHSWHGGLQTFEGMEGAIARASELHEDDPKLADMLLICKESAAPPRALILIPTQLRAECEKSAKEISHPNPRSPMLPTSAALVLQRPPLSRVMNSNDSSQVAQSDRQTCNRRQSESMTVSRIQRRWYSKRHGRTIS
jgi:hypothetical protein